MYTVYSRGVYGLAQCSVSVHIHACRRGEIRNLSLLFSKDHIEKIDFQEIFIAVVNWPNSELYGAFAELGTSLFKIAQSLFALERTVVTRKKNSECRLCYGIIAADQYMSLMLCYALLPAIFEYSQSKLNHCRSL